MTYEQYWYGDPLMVRDYYAADKIKRERKNSEAWLQGAYVYDAIVRIAPVLHAFAKKNAKPVPYPEKPYSVENKEAKGNMPDEQSIKNEQLKAQLFFKNWARATANKFK